MDKVLHAGTVATTRDGKFLILGATLVERDGRAAIAYRAVGYPKGFAGAKSLGWLWPEDITEVCAEGYEDSEAKRYHERAESLFGQLSGLPIEEAEAIMKRQMEELRSGTGEQRHKSES